jgi:hypothetical protein
VTPTENAIIAYAILDEVNADLGGGRLPEFVALDIARAQVYATLATVPAKPTHSAIAEAVREVLVADGFMEHGDLPWDAATAVEALL